VGFSSAIERTQSGAVIVFMAASTWNSDLEFTLKTRTSTQAGSDCIRDSLHWLLVQQRVNLSTDLYQCLHQLVAPYLVSMISLVSAVSTRRHLLSAGQGDLVVPWTSPRSFSVAGPSVWNSRQKLAFHYGCALRCVPREIEKPWRLYIFRHATQRAAVMEIG